MIRGSCCGWSRPSDATPCTSQLTLRKWTERLWDRIHVPVVFDEEGHKVGYGHVGFPNHCLRSRSLCLVPSTYQTTIHVQPLPSVLSLHVLHVGCRATSHPLHVPLRTLVTRRECLLRIATPVEIRTRTGSRHDANGRKCRQKTPLLDPPTVGGRAQIVACHHGTVGMRIVGTVEAHVRQAPTDRTTFAATRLRVVHVRGKEERERTRKRRGRADETKTRAHDVTQLERHVHLAIAQRLVQTHKVSQGQPIDEQRNECHLHGFSLVPSSVPTPKNDD